jgi:gliding motility-associated-like protein
LTLIVLLSFLTPYTSDRHVIALTGTTTDKTQCVDNGTASLSSISEDAVAVLSPYAGWNLALLDANKTNITASTTWAGSLVDPFTNMADGTYFLRVQNDATKCFSEPYQLSINDTSTDPNIDISIISPQYSLNPNPLSWTGILHANVTEQTTGLPGPAGYTYSWYDGTDITSASISVADSVSGLNIGEYTVVARNNDTGCESAFSAFMPFEFLEPTFNSTISPKTVCFPDNGSIEIVDVALAGSPDALSDYTFFFHDNFYNPGDNPDATVPGNDTQTIYRDLNSGNYYIIAREEWWMLNSNVVKVEVNDSTTNPIIIFDPANYRPLTSCDATAVANGALGVDVYEDNSNIYLPPPPYSYAFRWYRGDNANPSSIIAGETNNVVAGLTTGNYTVLVENEFSKCQAQSTFIIEDKSIIPIVVASQSPNMNCDESISNGIVSANVVNTDNPHVFNWYEGTNVGGAPLFSGTNWEGRKTGFYTVVAVDQQLGTCVSTPVLVEVLDATVKPIVLINELSPVTNCDPYRPNGILTAVTQDGIIGHTFKWYDNELLHFTGPTPTNLGLTQYKVVVTNDATLCKTVMTTMPTALLGKVPSPDVSILSERTSCVDPDGIVTASIEGDVTRHIYTYFHSATGEVVDNYYEDYKLYDLDASGYYVIAEDRSTGCISDSTVFVISDDTYFPEIEAITLPSSCEDADGFADVIISDLTREFDVVWRNEQGMEWHLKELVYVPQGKYTVEVEGTDGCISTLTTEVKGDLKVFNGVSPNGDGMNDYFRIACLENFPDNNVRIYNRAGLLVYEQNGYDNYTEKRFEGFSNRGLSILGKELPIGTYFYVIDKNDGSKGTVGYLELKR